MNMEVYVNFRYLYMHSYLRTIEGKVAFWLLLQPLFYSMQLLAKTGVVLLSIHTVIQLVYSQFVVYS